ncbi:Nucleolar protein 16 [Lachnellula arida]|uniref:Nucleolar protein 16 n=1 Tax=Lachnellula arida TaxID=1316785 RepID=A0A8T9BLI9_9HELO|nr:Nucleolar protein 16 [Lachnellula arida]
MGRELQKKKKRSSIPKIKLKPKSKRVNPLGNPIIAANWWHRETTCWIRLQNLNHKQTRHLERIPKTFAPTEAKVERDPDTGKIIRVIHAASRPNPLNDPLNSESEDDSMCDDGEEFEGFDSRRGERTETNPIVQQLEDMAARAPEKTPRKQSEREREWIERLVGKYGEDYKRMARDMKLNPMQQTEADIRKRVEKWRSSGGAATQG